MPEKYVFFTEVDPTLRIRIPNTMKTVVFHRGRYETADPHECLALQAHPHVISPDDLEIELREPVLVEGEEEEVLALPDELRHCEAVTQAGKKCTIPTFKAGEIYCHVHRKKIQESPDEK